MQKFSSRDNMSDAVAGEVRNRIVDGRLAAGARINEVHLSQELGVSRTPLREALAKLSQEGALDAVPRIGYSVRPLSLTEFSQIYPIRALLDPEALTLAGLPAPERLAELRALNEKIEQARGADRIVDLDDQWHLLLLSGCPNEVLMELIRQFMRRTRRYELALMREQRNVAATCDTHRAIMSALRRRDLDGAVTALRRNLESGYDTIADWLSSRAEG